MNISKTRLLILSLFAIAAIIALTLFIAPSSNKSSSGSTFGRNPDGYGAWYQYMSDRGSNIERWQKPFSEFIEKRENAGVTYIQIRSKEQFDRSKLFPHRLSNLEKNWLEQGNTLVIVGEFEPATAATFNSILATDNLDEIKIATTRRKQITNNTKTLLKDDFGAVAWEQKFDAGKVIYVATPFIAANAYQDFSDNYQFLAELVTENSTIVVDEYIHNYKDKETIARESSTSLWGYLARTPWFILFVQSIILILVAIASELRRFGQPVAIKRTVVDNSMAYIQALAGVLEKAECSDFIIETIGKDEQRKLQQSLGLGKTLLDKETLVSAWQQETGKSSAELDRLLGVMENRKGMSEGKLMNWIAGWREILK